MEEYHQANCLVCGDLVIKSEPVEDSSLSIGGRGDSGAILQYFFNLFEVREQFKLWNWDEEQAPFCVSCGDQVRQLLKLHKRLEELENAIKEGRLEIKEKLKFSEGFFESAGIYKKNKRYFQVRNQIISRDTEEVIINEEVSSPVLIERSRRTLPSKQNKSREFNDSCRRSLRNSNKPKTDYVKTESHNIHASSQVDPVSPTRAKNDGKRKSSPPLMEMQDDTFFMDLSDLFYDNYNYPNESQMEHDDIQPISNSHNNSKPKKKRKRGSDDEWEPPSVTEDQPESQSGNEDSDDSVSDLEEQEVTLTGPRQMQFDTVTDTCTLLHVTLTKLLNNKYQCQLCSKEVHKKYIRPHVLNVHVNRFRCKKCGKQFLSLKPLELHLKKCRWKTPLSKLQRVCPVCSKTVSKNSFLEHKWTHYGEQDKIDAVARGEKNFKPLRKDFQCDDCGKEFNTGKNLRRHKANVHVSRDSKAKELCPYCGKDVLTKSFKVHINSHKTQIQRQADNKFFCEDCSLGFAHLSGLEKHRKIHTRPYLCTRCPKRFPSEKDLEFHTNMHLNLRPYKCDMCKASFSNPPGLKSHFSIFHKEGSQPKRKSFVRGLAKSEGERKKNKKIFASMLSS